MNNRSLTATYVVAALLLLVLSVAAANTAAAQQAAIPEITIEAVDFGYHMPDEVEVGLAAINFTNSGQAPHHAQIARLNEGVTPEDFNAAIQEGPEAALLLVTLVGGPATIAPGASSRVAVEFEEGTHVVLCFVEDENGVPHVAHGMIRYFDVTPASGDAVSPPEADVTVDMHDFAFDIPTEIQAGRQTWQVTNSGPQPHEMNLVRLAPGKPMDDVAAYMDAREGASPFTPVGGVQGMSQGLANWVTFDLEQGTYVAICFIPDPATGQPHVELGMISTFSIGTAPETLPETGGTGTSWQMVVGWLLLAGLVVLTARGILIRRRRLGE